MFNHRSKDRREHINSSLFPLFFTLVLLFGSFSQALAAQPRYVFLFIGDGMGFAQRNAAELFLAGTPVPNHKQRVSAGSHLVMNSLPVQGSMSTRSLSGVTDSAAAGTALATGKKTINGRIAMDASGTVPFDSIAKQAKRAGMKVGIVTSAFLQDATPAVFYANSRSRKDYYDIGLQLIRSGFDYFGGGGFRRPTGKSKDKPHLLSLAQKNGFTVIYSPSVTEEKRLKDNRVLYIASRLSGAGLPYEIDRKPADPPLKDFVRRGIQLLDNPIGFFMMVEGAKIDLACHANDLATSIRDTLALDEAIAEALAFYRTKPDETLILVVSDHETGGLNLSGVNTQNCAAFYSLLARQSSSYLIAEGKAKQLRSPVDSLFFGLTTQQGDPLCLLPQEKKEILNAWKGRGQKNTKKFGPYHPLTVTQLRIRDKKLGVSWQTFYHTGKDVPVSAIGTGQEKFKGKIDIVDLYSILVDLLY